MSSSSRPGLSLPDLPDHVDNLALAAAFHEAAEVLEREGRRALSACVFGAGNAMRGAAAALRECTVALNATETAESDIPERVMEALECLAGFAHWLRPQLTTYAASLRELTGRAAASSIGAARSGRGAYIWTPPPQIPPERLR